MKRNKNFLRFLQLYGICIFLLSTQLTVVFAQSPSGSIASKMVHSNKSETSIFPNPASDILNINISNNNPATLIVRDISGRVLESATFSTQTSISTENYPNGMIFCEIWQGNERISTERIIVQH